MTGAICARIGGMRRAAVASFDRYEKVRELAAAIKLKNLDRLDEKLKVLIDRMQGHGAQVHLAVDAAEANNIITQIALDRSVRRIVKSKSMTAEEIGLNPALERAGLEVVETDLGDFICQLFDDPPSHILGPALHRTRFEIARLFSDKLGMAYDPTPGRMTMFAREVLREKFLGADMGLSGVNFAVAETGTLVLVTNEGNGRMSTTLPRIHVALMGLEKVVADLDDLGVFLDLLARSASGQKMSVYTSLLSGSRRPGEPDGPDEMHLVILDNGRSAILADPEMRPVLACLRCGACLNVCPIYRQVGGHAFGHAYSGPIGMVLTPLLVGLEEAGDLPQASTLCGACAGVCPVKIDHPRLLHVLRSRLDRAGSPLGGRVLLDAFAALGLSGPLFQTAAAAMQRALKLYAGPGRKLPGRLSGWTSCRDLIKPGGRSRPQGSE
ncbi:MAG: iron-sulfur cluster-binding protein [Proteobacteria bacterium]|nr:iron-sulfur cluster-binding protein [Pseudomonadota bacterium]MBU1741947.1 iron-sulfur cluster-binding protein [Pseudomonadota bacterium]